MAALLVLGRAGLGQFQDDVVNRPELQAMVALVDVYNIPDADAAGADTMRSYVEVRLMAGRAVSGQGDFARGSPEKPMSFDDTVAKFEGCADFAGLPRDRVGRIVSTVRNLEAVPDRRAVLMGLFA